MFTGIIECVGKIIHQHTRQAIQEIVVESRISSELRVDQSVSHNGICLTVVAVSGNTHAVQAVPETIQRTTLKNWKENESINLERCLKADGRVDEHFVQGHVDAVGKCERIIHHPSSVDIVFSYPENYALLLVEKGSIAVNGVSVTCYSLSKNTFQVSIIPYTQSHTQFQFLKEHDEVNLEFDIIGKYIQRRTLIS